MLFKFFVRTLLPTTLIVATIATGDARAQDSSGYSATATTKKPIPATSRDDATASGTEIETAGRPLALETVSDALREAPGTRTQQLGGFGSYSGLSLRGANTGHTSVLLGNLPLDSIDDGAFDFSLLPLNLFDRMVVYRGGAPAWLGEGSIGGVVQLLPSTTPATDLQLSSGVGSFGRYHLGLTTRVAPNHGNWSMRSAVSVDGATNDFPYTDPGAPLIQGDERERNTDNAQVTQASGLAHVSTKLGGGELEFVLLALGRTAGIPGPQRAPSPFAHRQMGRANASVGYTYSGKIGVGRRYRLQAMVGAAYQFQRVSDRGQIGTTFFAETDDRWSQLFVRLAGAVDVTTFLELTALAVARLDHIAPVNQLAFRAPPRPSQRTSETAVVEARLHGSVAGIPSELRGSTRLQFSQASIQATRNTDSAVLDVNLLSPTMRVAGVIAPWPALSLGASISSGERLPTIGEIFGDRAFLQPNPDLRPERSFGGDLSATVMGHVDDFCAQVELRAFRLAIDDFITYLRSARFDARPENLGYVTVHGAELGTRLSYTNLAALTLSMTAMDSRTPLGLQAPNRPNLVLYGRAETSPRIGGVLDRVTLWADLSVVSFNYTDRSNLHAIAGRQWIGVGAALHVLDNQVELQLRASNLLDQASEDLNGFALPRRALMASLTLRENLR